MQIDISQVLTAGQHIGRVCTEAQSYTRSINGPLRQACGTNPGFSAVGQLGNTLDFLGRRVDHVITGLEGTGGNILTAAQAHVDTELRNRGAMDALTCQLNGAAPLQPLGEGPAVSDGQRTALAAGGPIAPAPSLSPLGGWETASNATQTALGRFGDGASYMADARYGRFAPRGPNGQFISPNNMSPWQRAVSGANGEFRAIPNQSATRANWIAAGKWAGRAGGALEVATSTAGQVARDWNNPRLTGDQKVGRAAWRGAVEGGGAVAAGAAGAKIGAGLGTLVTPGVGTVIGGALGGIAGGFLGSELGGWIADRTVEGAGNVLEWITPW